MVKNDLIERYVYAVTKYMKADLKKDVSAELETIIQDMLEERCGDVMPTEHDIRVVLTELGTPAELASKYKSETQDWSALLQSVCVCTENCNGMCYRGDVTRTDYGSSDIAYYLVYSHIQDYRWNFWRCIDRICICYIVVCVLL